MTICLMPSQTIQSLNSLRKAPRKVSFRSPKQTLFPHTWFGNSTMSKGLVTLSRVIEIIEASAEAAATMKETTTNVKEATTAMAEADTTEIIASQEIASCEVILGDITEEETIGEITIFN